MDRRIFLGTTTGSLLGLSPLARALAAQGDAAVTLASTWPTQTVGYRTALPGVSGYGMDSWGGGGQHPTNPNPNTTTVGFLDDLGSGDSGSVVSASERTYHGTARYLHGLPGPKVIVLNRSGIIDLGEEWRMKDYTSVYGQFTPGSTIFRGTPPMTVRVFPGGSFPEGDTATHVQWWHLDVRPGDDAGGIAPNDRDGANFRSANPNGGGIAQNVAINCAFMWSIDELVDAYAGMDLATFVYCYFGEPLHKSLHTHETSNAAESHGYGPILGGGAQWDRICMQRCLFAHTKARMPLATAQRLAVANTVVYNPGDTDGNEAAVLQLTNHNGQDTAKYTNWVRNLVIRGPNGNNSIRVVEMATAAPYPAGSQGHLEGNAIHGWTFASQSALMRTTGFPAGWYQAALVTEAWPAGWGANKEGTVAIGAGPNPNNYSPAEKLAFATLVGASVGPKPGARSTADRVRVIVQQMLDALNGVGNPGNAVNSVAGTEPQSGWPNPGLRFAPNAGGYPSISSVTVDPNNPGSHWAAPIPTVGPGQRDVPYTSGTFSNGRSKVGYTRLEEWALERHWAVGGK